MEKQTAQLASTVTRARRLSFKGSRHPHEQVVSGYYYSGMIGGPEGDLPITGVCLSVPQTTARRMLDLRNQILLCRPQLNFSIMYSTATLGITYGLEDLDSLTAYTLKDPIVAWERPDMSRESDLGVDTSEIVFTPEGDMWFQVIVEGPSVAQVFLEPDLLEEIALGKPRPRMRRG